MAYSLTTTSDTTRLLFANAGRSVELHPIWLRERTTEEGEVDPLTKQRLYDPADIDPFLVPTNIEPNGTSSTITWSDDHVQRVDHDALAAALGWVTFPEALPPAASWSSEPNPFPHFDWPGNGDDSLLHQALEAFWTHGFVVFSNASTEPGSLEQIAGRFGPVRVTNFGKLFDVFSKPNPVDLAYTPLELKAHTDNPYRSPVPSIQFLHCLVNDATGGESTLVDGKAAAEDYAAIDPEGYETLTKLMVTFWYQYENELLGTRAPILETEADGTFFGIRNSDRVDFVDAVDPDILDVFYRARAGLRRLLNKPARRATFLLRAGDVMMMNNRRLLHGRNSYALATGMRHLQGCYIEFDGPELLFRGLNKSAHTASSSPSQK